MIQTNVTTRPKRKSCIVVPSCSDRALMDKGQEDCVHLGAGALLNCGWESFRNVWQRTRSPILVVTVQKIEYWKCRELWHSSLDTYSLLATVLDKWIVVLDLLLSRGCQNSRKTVLADRPLLGEVGNDCLYVRVSQLCPPWSERHKKLCRTGVESAQPIKGHPRRKKSE